MCCRSATYALQVSRRQQNVDQREPVANGVNISDINPSKIEKYDFSSILRVLQMKSKQFEIICKYFN